MFRGWQLKEELREIFSLPLIQARQALDEWLAWASRSKLAPFVKLARTIRHYRDSIEARLDPPGVTRPSGGPMSTPSLRPWAGADPA